MILHLLFFNPITNYQIELKKTKPKISFFNLHASLYSSSSNVDSEGIGSMSKRNIDIESCETVDMSEKTHNETDKKLKVENTEKSEGISSENNSNKTIVEKNNTEYILVKEKIDLDDASSQKLAFSREVSVSESTTDGVESHEIEGIRDDDSSTTSSNAPAESIGDETSDNHESELNNENENHERIGNNDAINGSETNDENQDNDVENNTIDNNESNDNEVTNRNNNARNRWIQINQQFQILVTLVTLVFSILIFCILVCWVIFTSAYVMSMELVSFF